MHIHTTIFLSLSLSVCLSPAFIPFSLAPSATRESRGFINVRHYRFSRGIAIFIFIFTFEIPLARSIIAARKYRSATAAVVFSTSASLFPIRAPPDSSASIPFHFPPRPLQPLHLAPSPIPPRRPHGIPRDFELCFSLPPLFARRRADIATSYPSYPVGQYDNRYSRIRVYPRRVVSERR